MGEHEVGRLIYLMLLGVVLLSYLLVSNRARLGAMLRGALLWGLIFLGVAVGAMLWQDVRGDMGLTRAVSFGDGRVEVPRDGSGHFFATLQVQGVPVRFIVDTGATDVVLARSDALRLGLDPDHLVYSGQARTANGTVRTARITLDEVTLGDFTDRGLRAWVNEGEMDYSLLGMGYLERFERVEISRDRLILFR
ncbi:retropepsin-like aspartic protease family protein [Rhodobaculum claviforme]|uniref:Aspartyl protease n=1 Tax=Rhodobaculum claviforme TaxID=1549854 RepID=A0A934TIT4_9RHOB|nr:TIGR02281 family clan AA aspartic protease [Rhodobaculum claviforme]MBK5926261.1 aspartyl protease [Rhodobaculum claviforme]